MGYSFLDEIIKGALHMDLTLENHNQINQHKQLGNFTHTLMPTEKGIVWVEIIYLKNAVTLYTRYCISQKLWDFSLDTVYLCWSRGCKTAGGQILRFEKRFKD